MMNNKRTVCLDFDGVIHSYNSAWKGPCIISDDPVPGAIDALMEYTKTFTVCIHSSRFNIGNNSLFGIQDSQSMEAVKDWLISHGVPASKIIADADLLAQNEPPDGIILLVATKPPAWITIDDRAVTFTGAFPDAETILAFRPWNKKSNI
jgi:hypothetical protein